MKKFFSSIFIIIMSVLVLNLNYAAAQEAEPEAAAAPEAPAAPVKKAAKKAPVKKAAKAKPEKKGETLSSLIKTFNSVHKDIEFAQKYVNPKSEEFDKTMAKALANDLLKWKKAKIQIKKLKKDKSPKLEATEEKLKELEESIVAKYTESAAPAAEETATEETASGDEEAVAKTEKGKEILEKLKQKRASEEGTAEAEKPAEESKPEAEKPAVKQLSKLRINPSRALYNRIEPGAEATTRISVRNQAKSVYEGTVVPIENWITVNPTVVTIEPGSSIDVEVNITAPSAPKTRLEGSIELRTEGESSKRVPVVVRTK
ncbi:MAG TPA: hypothetical protein PKW98_06450 [Candidatus Wallbacteria bacterium]|nr:MAG: hypothetical protein BWY32_00646 [bacterium ADurb.Bin243]HOD41923.1 hypothetical protein [Candidatus Wallbacteria bacterium]HPG57440.1 hypothetical protein [Candidatus Wallbacteria bacterium]